MATTFYLRDAPGVNIGGSVSSKLLALDRGAAATSRDVTATASGTNIPWTDGAGGNTLRWYTNPLQAVTISGVITCNIRGLESATGVNSGVNVSIGSADAAGAVLTAIAASTISTEWTTSETAKSITATPGVGVTINAGERLRIIVNLRNVGTMGAGTASLFYDGPTGSATGDSFLTFTETILEIDTPELRGRPFGLSGAGQMQQLLSQ